MLVHEWLTAASRPLRVGLTAAMLLAAGVCVPAGCEKKDDKPAQPAQPPNPSTPAKPQARATDELVRTRAESARATDENARLRTELDAARARLADAEGAGSELTVLRSEREQIRSRVDDMLRQIEALNL